MFVEKVGEKFKKMNITSTTKPGRKASTTWGFFLEIFQSFMPGLSRNYMKLPNATVFLLFISFTDDNAATFHLSRSVECFISPRLGYVKALPGVSGACLTPNNLNLIQQKIQQRKHIYIYTCTFYMYKQKTKNNNKMKNLKANK